MPSWYAAETGNHQGLVIEEGTGRNVAVCYDKADAPIVAAAPAMLALLHIMVNETEANGAPSRRAVREARQLFCDMPEPDFSLFAEIA